MEMQLTQSGLPSHETILPTPVHPSAETTSPCRVSTALSLCIIALLLWVVRRVATTTSTQGVSALPIPRVTFLENFLATIATRFPHLSVTKLAEKYGKIFSMKVGKLDFVVLNDIDMVRQMMAKFPTALSGKPLSLTAQMTGPGAHTDEGKRWKKRRAIAMHSVKSFFRESPDVIFSIIEEELDSLFGKLNTKVGDEAQDVHLDLTLFVARVMFRLTYGQGNSPDEQTHEELIKIASSIRDYSVNAGPFSKLDLLPFVRIIYNKSYNKYLQASKLFKNICSKYTSSHLAQSCSETLGMTDLMSFFMRAAGQTSAADKEQLALSDELIYGGLEDLIRAGCESPTLLLQWFVLCLVKFPEVQDKMAEEVRDHLRDRSQAGYCDLNSLPYTKAVFYETVRFCSLVPFLKRKTLEDIMIGDMHVPKDTAILINNHAISQDSTRWHQAEQFHPERFLSDDGSFDNRKMELFLPFGIGKRRCIGEEIGKGLPFVTIASLIQNFSFKSAEGESPNLVPEFGITMTPSQCKVIISKRT